MAEQRFFGVTVVLAEVGLQRSVSLQVAAGTTAWQAVSLSGLLEGRADLVPSRLGLAVYGRQVEFARPLEEGDRVEILRPLLQDPKIRRRQAARRAAKRSGRAR